MADTIIEVGAVIDLSQILPGLNNLVAQTQITTNEMRASLEKLDVPVKVGQIAPTPASVGITPEAIQGLSTVVTDLQIKEEKLTTSVKDMREEVEKAGSSLGVKSNWMKRLSEEETALALVTDVLTAAEKTLSEATDVLVQQQRLAMRIQEQMAAAQKEATSAIQQAIPATAELAATTGAATTKKQEETVATSQSTVSKRENVTASTAEKTATDSTTASTQTANETKASSTVVTRNATKESAAYGFAQQEVKIAENQVMQATAQKILTLEKLEEIQARLATVTKTTPTDEPSAAARNTEIAALNEKLTEGETILEQRELELTQARAKLETASAELTEKTLALNSVTAESSTINTETATTEKAKSTALEETTAALGTNIAATDTLTGSNVTLVDSATVAAGAVSSGGVASTVTSKQTDLLTQSTRELAVSLMAEGRSANEAAQILLRSGVASATVKTTFDSLGQSIKAVEGDTKATGTGLQALLAQQRAAGAGVNEFAATMRSAGLSSKEMITQLTGMGFSVEGVANALAQLGIKTTVTRTEILRMATAAGATRDQLERLREMLEQVKTETQGVGVAMNQSRTIFGALDGSLGMMTSGLARVAAASKFLQPVISAAFPLFAAFAFIDILRQVEDTFKKVSDTVGGYTDEVKKAEQANIKASESAQALAGSLEESYQKTGETLREQASLATEGQTAAAQRGIAEAEASRVRWLDLVPVLNSVYQGYLLIEGALGGVEDATKRAVKDQELLSAQHAARIKVLEEEDKFSLKMMEKDVQITNIGKTKVEQLQEEMRTLRQMQETRQKIALDEVGARVVSGQEGQGAIERTRIEQHKIQLREDAELMSKYGVATLEERIALERAITEAEKSEGLAQVAQRQKLAEEQFAAGKLTLAQETAALRAAADEKFRIDLDAANKKRAIIEEEKGTGKDIKPALQAADAEIQTLKINHETTLTSIENTEIEKRRRLNEEYANAVITGETKIATQQIEARKAAAKNAFEANTLTESEYTSTLIGEEIKRTTAVEIELKKRRDAVAQFTNPDQQKAKLKELDDEETAEKLRHTAALEEINSGSQRRINEVERKNIIDNLNLFNETTETKARNVERTADEQIRSINRLQAVGLITFNQEIARNLAVIENEKKKVNAIYESAIAYEKEAQAAATSLIAQEAAQKKIIDLEKQRDKANEQTNEKIKRQQDDLDNYIIAKNQATYNIIGQSFNSAFDRMLTEHTKFKNVMFSFWNEMVQGWARMGLQILGHYVQMLGQMVLQHALALLHIRTLEATHVTFMGALHALVEAVQDALGIKRVAKTVVTNSAETAANKTQYTADVVAKTTAETAKTTAVTTNATLRSTAETSGLALIATAEAAARATESAATSAKDVAEVISLAAVGAAGAAAAAAPAGPAAMAAAAAAAESIILAYVPQAAVVAEKGAFIDKDTPAFLHKNETVLPPKLSLGFQNIINAGAFGGVNVPTTLTTPAGPVPEGKVNVTHVHNNKVVNSKPNVTVNVNGQQHPRLTQGDIEAAVMRGVRNGGIRINV